MTDAVKTFTTVIESPVGRLRLTSDGERLTRLLFHDPAPDPAWIEDRSVFTDLIRELDEYFEGSRTSFDVPVRLNGTPFQRSVWAALQEIPYGETRTYGQIAASIGRPTAVRAVGLANGQNPVSIVVPCHRVIGSNGSLTGYGGGLERKRLLLDLEIHAEEREPTLPLN